MTELPRCGVKLHAHERPALDSAACEAGSRCNYHRNPPVRSPCDAVSTFALLYKNRSTAVSRARAREACTGRGTAHLSSKHESMHIRPTRERSMRGTARERTAKHAQHGQPDDFQPRRGRTAGERCGDGPNCQPGAHKSISVSCFQT